MPVKYLMLNIIILSAASKEPRLDTVENVMKLSQMVVQAMWDNKSPLLQLPHITQDTLKHFITKTVNLIELQYYSSIYKMLNQC